ncbi:predicted protein [Naegleria gruberi]|uniref:Predicted protein n=1 Tax=Naegleria gruberi TaxID=5762 RepID=D2V3S0_NAEGR|nr:uncharacterized protein NAEGRDRAFT_46454 [Naegleria gruberi]EFC48820.1 predicted protein [Naegleria gruberi]|eukprot:XP_002681564.1 predicted protein [Naegleria gruberi strain NEG-M]
MPPPPPPSNNSNISTSQGFTPPPPPGINSSFKVGGGTPPPPGSFSPMIQDPVSIPVIGGKVNKIQAKKSTKQYINVREIIGPKDVFQALRIAPSVFKELFGVSYPNNSEYLEGQQIAQVVFEDFELNLIWARDMSQTDDSYAVPYAMTDSTHALWELLGNNGFELRDSRNYLTYQTNRVSRFNGRMLCERVFERDLSKM